MAGRTGLRISEPDGSIRVDTTTQIGHPVGYVDTGSTNGSISDSRLGTGGTPILIAVLPTAGHSWSTVPIVTVTTTGVSWAFTNPAAANGNCRIFYGLV